MYETIQVDRNGSIAHIWLNRPDKLNAVNLKMMQEIFQACEELQQDRKISIVVLAGRGRAFSVGADINAPPALADWSKEDNIRWQRYSVNVGRRVVEAIERLEATTIARIHGYAVGGGLVLALACDLRIAADTCKFRIPEVDLGVPLLWGAVPRLIACVGPMKARELILLSEEFNAAAAERYGMLNRIVREPDLDEIVDGWIFKLNKTSELSRHVTKTQFRGYAHLNLLGNLTEFESDSMLIFKEFFIGKLDGRLKNKL